MTPTIIGRRRGSAEKGAALQQLDVDIDPTLGIHEA